MKDMSTKPTSLNDIITILACGDNPAGNGDDENKNFAEVSVNKDAVSITFSVDIHEVLQFISTSDLIVELAARFGKGEGQS